MELLEAQKHIDNKIAKTSNLNNTLKDIQLSLAQIERKESTIAPRNYVIAAAQNSPKSNATTTPLHKTPKPKQALQNPTSKEARQAREIIRDKADKEKIRMVSTKNLMQVLQTETKRIWRIFCLISGNIKIHAESLKAKKVLQDKTK